MPTTDIFKKRVVPKLAFLFFLVIALAIIKEFPIPQTPILGQPILFWVEFFVDIAAISFILSLLSGLSDLLYSIIRDSVKPEKFDSWQSQKKESLKSLLTNSITVILILICYKVIAEDLSFLFITSTIFSTLIGIAILILGIFFLYKAYLSLREFIEIDTI